MKLIDEKLVEEAAKVAASFDKNKEIDYDERYYNNHNCAKYDAYKSGVDFAEQQLKQKMIEFAEWYVENYSDIGNKEWTDRDYYIKEKTTEQLLEEFINQQK